MDILPTKVSSFRSSSYWNRFYSNPKLKEFEWYIDIKDILPTFYKCILERDCSCGSKDDLLNSVVVNIGCGNSNVSEVLVNEGFRTIYNIDFSQQVLDEMSAKCRDGEIFVNIDVSKQEYVEFGDMLNQKYPNSPKVIVDKAFMDSFISIDESESKDLIKARAKIYLESTFKMMNYSDVFIIISVSQDYMLMELMRNILMKHFYVDIYPLYSQSDVKAHMIHFIYSIYKYDAGQKTDRKQCRMRDMPNLPCEYFEAGQLLKRIKMAKTTLYLGPTIKRHTPERRLVFDIFPNNKTDTCFTVVVYDSVRKSSKIKNACIIVPAGQEHLWLYATAEGNQELAMSANCTRLLLIWLKYTKDFSNLLNLNPLDPYSDEKAMEYIQTNLAETLDSFSLEKSSGITIMKVGESASIRRWICELPSKHAGKVIVRDLYHEDESDTRLAADGAQIYARQMIFSSNPQVIQSELLFYEKDGNPVFLFHHPTNEYHVAIALAMVFLGSFGRVLILGGGTGVLTNILLQVLENKMVVVELDEAVLKVAKDYFGYTFEDSLVLSDSKETDDVDVLSQVDGLEMKILHITGDALKFIKGSKGAYAAIVLDINNSNEDDSVNTEANSTDGSLSSGFLMSPNPLFLESEVLDKMERMLSENRGILILNLLTRSKQTRKLVLDKLMEKFVFIALIKTPNDINELLICSSVTISNAIEIFKEYAHKLELKKIVKDPDAWIDRLTIVKR